MAGDHEMSYETIVQQHQKERHSKKLTPLEPGFYIDLLSFLNELHAEYRSLQQADPSAKRTMIFGDQLRDMERFAEEIYTFRERKITRQALDHARGVGTSTKAMIPPEQRLFDALVKLLKDARSTMMGSSSEPSPSDPSSVPISATEPVPPLPSTSEPFTLFDDRVTGASDASVDDLSPDLSESEPAAASDTASAPSVPDHEPGMPVSTLPAPSVSSASTPSSVSSSATVAPAPAVPDDMEADVEDASHGRSDRGPQSRSTPSAGAASPASASLPPDPDAPLVVRILEPIPSFVTPEGRMLDLAAEDVITLPADIARILFDHGSAERLVVVHAPVSLE